MRGRLRVVRDYDKELNDEKSKLEAGVEGGKVIDYGLPNGRELPDYEGNRLPLKRTAPGRPKKNREKKNTGVQTRANDSSMLKRQGTSLKCSKCGQWEHNIRSCPSKAPEDNMGEDGMEQDGVKNWQGNRPKCSYCNEVGHNSRTCPSKRHDLEVQRKEELAKEAENHKIMLEKIQATQNEMHAQKGKSQKTATANQTPARTKQLARRNPRSKPFKNATPVKIHGGIVQPFKAPAQTAQGVECFERNGQNFTTLRQLEAATRKKKKKGTMDNK